MFFDAQRLIPDYILVSDLHGCADEARELLKNCNVSDSTRVIFCGDLVDRGPKVRECVELAQRHESVMGNHEHRFIDRYRRQVDLNKVAPHHLLTFSQLSGRHVDYLESLPKYISIPEYNVAVVHAGVRAGIELSRHSDNFVMHAANVIPLSVLNKFGHVNRWHYTSGIWDTWWASKAPAHSMFWAQEYEEFDLYFAGHTTRPTVVYGHSYFTKPVILDYSIGLDTGCVFGGSLSAYRLPQRDVISVACHRKDGYHRSQHRGPSSRALTEIMSGHFGYS